MSNKELENMRNTCSCGSKQDVEEQYSFGVYAGRMCRKCAIETYRDHCGWRPSDLTQADLDEQIEAD